MLRAATICICLCFAIHGWARASVGFSDPVFPNVKQNACTAADISFTVTSDHSVMSLLRREGALLRTENTSMTTARCRIGLVVTKPAGSKPLLQVDLRGADQKAARSQLKLTIKAGRSQHRASYPAGEVLDGGATTRRFQIAVPAAGTSTIWLDIEATARSLDGKDGVLVSLDSIDACFIDPAAESAACTALAPARPVDR